MTRLGLSVVSALGIPVQNLALLYGGILAANAVSVEWGMLAGLASVVLGPVALLGPVTSGGVRALLLARGGAPAERLLPVVAAAGLLVGDWPGAWVVWGPTAPRGPASGPGEPPAPPPSR